jgi:hypothetical protein
MTRNERRRRRIRGLAAVALTASCFLALASAAEAELVFEHPDGSPIQFKGAPRAWCGPWDLEVPRKSVHVELRNRHGGWEMLAVRRDVKVGRPIEFPNSFVDTKPRKSFLFVGVLGKSPIEASSAEEEGSGSMMFSHLDCDPGGLVEFSVEAVLGSELFGGESVKVSGTYTGDAGKPPRSISARTARVPPTAGASRDA